MPYYVSPYIGSGSLRDAFRPRGSDQSGWRAIDLRPDGGATRDGGGLNACLLYLPIHDPDPALVQFGDIVGEDLGPLARARLAARLGSTISFTRLDDVIADLLYRPPRNGWQPLAGREPIYLGPPLQPIYARTPDAYFAETWSCPDSASLTCDLTWVENIQGTAWGITSNRARLSGNVANNVARADHALTSGDMRVQANQYMSAVQFHVVGPLCRKDNTTTQTYYVFFNWNTADHMLRKYVAGASTDLDTPTQDAVSGELLAVEARQASIAGLVDGVVIAGPVTDTAIANTNAYGGMHGYTQAAGDLVELDNWLAYAAADRGRILRRTTRPYPFAPGMAR